MPSTGDGRRKTLICAALAAAVLAVYARVTGFEFVMYDDLATVIETPQVAAGLSGQGVVWALTNPHLANWHPVTTISHMLDVTLYGQDAGGHHVTSLLLHVLDTLLVFLVLEKMTRALWPSAFVAALFGLHPMHVESVAWIAERKDVLSALFWLLTMLAYARYVERRGAGRYVVTLIAFALGLMSKPMVVTLPFVLLLLDVWPLRRWRPWGGEKTLGGSSSAIVHRPSTRIASSGSREDMSGNVSRFESLQGLIAEKIPFLALSLVSSVITFRVQQKIGAVPTVDAFPPGARIANALVSYVRYTLKLIWPEDLSAFYSRPGAWSAGLVAGAAVFLIALTALALAMARPSPYLAVGWLWYVGTLVPVIGLVQVGMQSMADRYTYIPSIGLFIAVTWTLADFIARFQTAPRTVMAPDGFRESRREAKPGDGGTRDRPGLLGVAASAALVVLLALGVRAWRQVGVWRNTFTLFENAIALDPDNPVARNVLGLAYVRQGRLDEGIAQLAEAAQIKPNARTEYNLGMAYARKGSFAEALRHYEAAVADDSGDAKTHASLADALYHEGKLTEAASHYETSLRLDPRQPDVLTNLGACLADLGRTQEAVGRYTDALALRPATAETLNNLGAALASLGRRDEALARYADAVRLKPDYADAHENLGNLLYAQRRYAEAAGELEIVIRLRPGNTEAGNTLRKARTAAEGGPAEAR